MRALLSILLFSFLCAGSPISPDAALAGGQSNAATQGKPLSEGVTTFDGVLLAAIPAKQATAQAVAAAISRTGWTCTVDSAQAGNPCTNVLDGDGSTFWHSQYSPTLTPLPHQITIDMQASYLVGQISIEPRQDGNSNGNIGQHVISFSADGTTFTTVAYGTYMDDSSLKMTTFTPVSARYMRIQATTEAGNRGPWTSIAEVNAFVTGQAAPPNPAGKGFWIYTIDFPLVPVSLANEWSSGNILAWSSYNPSTFGGSSGTQTITATYAPGAQVVTQALVTNTQHDMFCEGLSIDFNGRIAATGGNTASATSFYDNGANTWIKGPAMNIARGYQAMATTSLGTTFTIGASWSGGEGGKNGELYNPSTNAWAGLSGAPVAPMLTADVKGVYRADNHGMLFGWKSGYVFQAGPSKAMNWYLTTGSGTQTSAGNRGNDNDIMCGNAAMYDAVAGKILTAGGALDYQNITASAAAHVITIGNGGGTPSVVTAPSMAHARSFANSVILPDGTVLVMGGQNFPTPFSDTQSVYVPELYSPTTNSWTQLPSAALPRNYHSTAVLMPDGSVINGGGGLCGIGCATNHFDAQIFNPPYLYTSSGALAARPTISSTSVTSVAVGKSFTATTGGAVSYFALLRLSSTTHTVNTDQRRIKLTPTGTAGNTYKLAIPNDPGVALPGYWFLFAMNSAGVPSVSKVIKVTAT